MSEARGIISRTGIYSIGTVLRGLTSFIMLPIYTRYLTPADYGVIELLGMIVDLATIFFGARLSAAVFRFYHREKTDIGRCRVISTSLYFNFAINAAAVTSLVVFSEFVADIAFGSPDYQMMVVVYSSALLFAAFGEIAIAYIRILDRPWLYVSISVAKLALQLGLNIWFIILLDLGVWGVIYASVISSAAMALTVGSYAFIKNGLGADPKLLKPMFLFTYPIAISAIGMFFITFGDRYFLRVYHDLTMVGIYALAYKFGFLLTKFMWSPFMTYWESRQYQVMDTEGGEQTMAQVFRYMNLVLVLGGLGIALFAPEIVYIVAAPEFAPAATVIPIVVLAYVFQAWTAYQKVGVLYAGKTQIIAVSTYITVAVIGALYILLIPSYGAEGAAWATVLGMYFRYLLIYRAAQRQREVPYKMAGSYIVIAGSVLLVAALSQLPLGLPSLTLKCGAFALVAAALWASPIVGAPGRRYITAGVQSLIKRQAA